MDRTELLYDHYKETIKANTDMLAKRNLLFAYVCVLELLNCMMLFFPQAVNAILSSFLKENYSIPANELLGILPSVIWIIVTYILVRYYQTTIYVERQYPYIESIEDEIAKETGLTCFDRESTAYLRCYPKVLDMIHFFYTWIIPVLLLTINSVKIILEWVTIGCTAFTWVNSAIYVFSLILTVMFLVFLHSPRKPKIQTESDAEPPRL